RRELSAQKLSVVLISSVGRLSMSPVLCTSFRLQVRVISLMPFCRRWATLPSLKWCVPASAESPAARKCWACKPCLRSVEKAGQRSWSAFLYLYLWRPYVLCRQLLPESADDGAF